MKAARALLRQIAVAPIRVYRRFISPFTPATCRFRPTCSAYAEEAVLRRGLLVGGWLTLLRVLRCHPFSEPGYDPVPPPRTHRARSFESRPGDSTHAQLPDRAAVCERSEPNSAPSTAPTAPTANPRGGAPEPHPPRP